MTGWQLARGGRWQVGSGDYLAKGHGSCWKNRSGGLDFLSGPVVLQDPGMSGRLGVEVWA